MRLNGGAATNTLLNIGSNVALPGGGPSTLSTATGSGAAFVQQSGGTFTLTNASTSTIRGEGVIGNGGLTLRNAGTIDANIAADVNNIGALTLNGSGAANAGVGVVNTGLLGATNGGMLQKVNTVNKNGRASCRERRK